jgi:hypothetical protein
MATMTLIWGKNGVMASQFGFSPHPAGLRAALADAT